VRLPGRHFKVIGLLASDDFAFDHKELGPASVSIGDCAGPEAESRSSRSVGRLCTTGWKPPGEGQGIEALPEGSLGGGWVNLQQAVVGA